jgi:hypothetical protein
MNNTFELCSFNVWEKFLHSLDLELTKSNLSKINCDENQPNTKRNHTNDSLEVPIGPITRAKAKKLKEALNGLVRK